MREDAKKVVVGGTDKLAGRELPMPAYRYQTIPSSKGPIIAGQTADQKPVKDAKIKSLQNLAFDR
jgi:hypothetical protein